MPRIVQRAVACAALLLALAYAGYAADAPTDLYLLIGQSNMAGRGTVDAESTKTHPRVFSLNKAGEWVPAVDPLHFDKPGAGVGPGLAFGKAMADAAAARTIGLVPCAVGGTSVTRWAPGVQDPVTKAYPYDDMLARIKIARKTGTFKGIIWHQGESDRGAKGREKYAALLTELVARVRKELDAPDLPFVAGELPPLNPANADDTAAFNVILHDLEKTIPHFAVVSAEGLKDRGDRLHFNADSARTLGARYAAAMQKLQAPPEEKK
jgi:hypothetical protein